MSRSKDYYLKHPDKKKEHDKRYRMKHRDEISKKRALKNIFLNSRKREWYKANKEHVSEYNKEWRKRNPNYDGDWKEKNMDKCVAWSARWAKNNKEKRVFYQQMRDWAKKVSGRHTIEEWESMKKRYNYTCPSCGKKEPEIKLTKDHIIPLYKKGENTIFNIQPLCRRCNCKKHTKIIKYELQS